MLYARVFQIKKLLQDQKKTIFHFEQILYKYFILGNRLHMLNELERGVQTLFEAPSDPWGLNTSLQDEKPASLKELREQWETRLNFVQVSFNPTE